MLKNYLKIALRNIQKRKGYSLINVTGLAIGITCCLLMLLYVRYEVSYDRFHEGADDIYRVALIDESPQTRTPHPMAQAMVRDFPEVEHAVSLTPIWGPGLTRPTYSVRYEDRRYDERNILAVDSTFLDVFSFPVYAGDAEAALRELFAILLTQSTARKYFGDTDPLGKRLTINDDTEVVVGAILEDVPANAHFHFDFLLSYVTLKQAWQGSPFFEWEDFGHYNYIRLAPGASPQAVEAKIPAWIQRYLDLSPEDVEELESGRAALRLQPLTDIHLRSHLRWELESNGHITYVYLFAAAALFILLIACINFMNLATARSANRAKEVGVRKTLGASRKQLALQFLGESILYSALAIAVALVFTELSLPLFNALSGSELSLDDLNSGTLIAGLVGIVLLTGLVSGSYPAFFLSAFRPARVLKGQRTARTDGAWFRKGLVTFQFALSISLIIGTLVISDQLHFLRSQDLGFDGDQVVVVPIKDEAMRTRYEAFKDALTQSSQVLHASAVSNVPGSRFNRNNIQWQDAPPVGVAELRVDEDFFETLGITLEAGRSFSRAFPADVGGAFILNETAARLFDWETPLQEEIRWLDEDSTYVAPVIGIAQDFHVASLRERVGPVIIQMWPGSFNYVLVKIKPERIPETLAFIEQTWTSFAPDRTFEYSFLNEDFRALYQAEEQTGTVVALFSALAVLVACLGLFGLAAYAAEQRTKEIGIRKVMGASVRSLVALLSTDFLKLVGFAFLVAAPLAYVAMHRWLHEFAYRVDISWPLFLYAGLTALGVALVTVSYQALRAALADPVKSLRYE